MIEIPSEALKAAGRLLKRLRAKQCTLPVLGHVLVESDPDRGVRLTTCNLDQWLQTRIPTDQPSDTAESPESLLVPAEALNAALKADKNTVVAFARRGPKSDRRVRLTLTRGGLTVQTDHPTLETDEFPACPRVPEGVGATPVPGRTFEMIAEIAGCASKDPSRHVLNGVLLTPEDGGRVVATDGRRLAAAPASVPDARLVIPTAAVRVLGHPDFHQGVVHITAFRLRVPKSDNPSSSTDETAAKSPDHLRIEAGDHVLVSRLIDGLYPNWQQVVPADRVASASFDESHRAAVIDWLRARGKSGCEAGVEIRPGKRRHLELSHGHGTSGASRIEVPAEITGRPQPVALGATYLTDALKIAPTLWFVDEMTPVVARRLDGTLCVVMPMRFGSSDRAAA
jgi:DNA polymerase-3 subunit beta